MKIRIIIALSALSFLAPAAFGQSTSVSATVTDAGGQAWFGGTYQVNFYPAPINPNGQYNWTGGPFNRGQVYSGSLDGSGSFTQSLPSNTAIAPAGSKWTFTVCPAATSTCYTSSPITITGATQSVTANIGPPGISISLLNNPPQAVRAYSDSELSGPLPGQIYWNLTMGTLRFWNGSIWQNIGSGGGAACGTLAANEVLFGTGLTTCSVDPNFQWNQSGHQLTILPTSIPSSTTIRIGSPDSSFTGGLSPCNYYQLVIACFASVETDTNPGPPLEGVVQYGGTAREAVGNIGLGIANQGMGVTSSLPVTGVLGWGFNTGLGQPQFLVGVRGRVSNISANTVASTYSFYATMDAPSNASGVNTTLEGYHVQDPVFPSVGTIHNLIGFDAERMMAGNGNTGADVLAIGYYSEDSDTSNSNEYSFYSSGTKAHFPVIDGTDSTGNVTAPNLGNIVNTVVSSVVTGNISATPMTTAGGSGNTYRFSAYLTQLVLGTSCSGTPAITVSVTLTDPNSSTPGTYAMEIMNVSGGGNGVVGGLFTQASGQPTYTFRAKAGSAVSYSTTVGGEAGCSPGPAYQVYPVLEKLN